jgi:hypothetical protein
MTIEQQEKKNGPEALLEFFDNASREKQQYYRDRPIMRFLHMIGLERGILSRATRYALEKAQTVLNNYK